MSSREIAIHIGLPKCGSTYLQRVFFPSHSGINYLGPFHANPEVDELWRYLTKTTDADWDKTKARRMAEVVLDSAGENKGVKVLSREDIGINWKIGYTEKADRIRTVFPEARIIVIVRDPVAFIESSYLQYAKGFSGKHAFVSFPEWWDDQVGPGGTLQIRSRLQYQKIVDLYARYYGHERVCVLPFEQFTHEHNVFFTRLCGFLGVSAWDGAADGRSTVVVNPRVSNVDLVRSRFDHGFAGIGLSLARRVVPPTIRSRLRGLVSKPATLTVPDRIRREIIDIYRRENGDFAQDWGILYGTDE